MAHQNGNDEICVINADGSDLKNLTNNIENETNPSWSPDGKKIIFASTTREKNWEIYIMNADGSERKNITNNPAEDFEPSWSPFLDSEK